MTYPIQRQADQYTWRFSRRLTAAEIVDDTLDRLGREFSDYATERGLSNPYDAAAAPGTGRGAVGYWPNIENFLKDNYPASHRGLTYGFEDADYLIKMEEGDHPPQWLPGKDPYETGPDAIATHGYDPKEVAAAMLLLHNESHPGRTSVVAHDRDFLLDLVQKRMKMQRDYEQRGIAPGNDSFGQFVDQIGPELDKLTEPQKQPVTAQRLAVHRTAAHEHVESGQRGRPDWTGCAHPECRPDLPTTMYHVSHPKNRDSIARHGLLTSYSEDDELSDALGMPHGVYMTSDEPKLSHDTERWPGDVWSIDITKLKHLENDFPGGMLFRNAFATKYDVPPEAMRLHRPSVHHTAARDVVTHRLAAVNQDLVDRLKGEFHAWRKQQPRGSIFGGGIIGGLNEWTNIEKFLKDKYPAAHRGLGMGYEMAGPLLDGKPMQADYMMSGPLEYSTPQPYETGPDAEAEHGYDPKEIAAAMLLLHNKTDRFRGDMSSEDQARLNDIAQKRYQMQRAYEQRQVTAMAWDEWAPKIEHDDYGSAVCNGRCDYDQENASGYKINHEYGQSGITYGHYKDENGNPFIGIIGLITDDDHRNDGVAEALVRRLHQDHPGVRIDPGLMTDMGQGFHDRMLEKEPDARAVVTAGIHGDLLVTAADYDDTHAYDSAGRHPLPYHGVNNDFDTQLGVHLDDFDEPDPDLITQARQHIDRHGIGPHTSYRTAMHKDTWEPGEQAHYEYHCLQSPESSDYHLWQRSHQPVSVLGVDPDSDDFADVYPTLVERGEQGLPRTYRVRFQDGHEDTAWEDELLTDPKHFNSRHAPPRTASHRTAMPAADAYDPDAPNKTRHLWRGKLPSNVKWYHASPHDLPDNTILSPGLAQSGNTYYYKKPNRSGRADWVWMERSPWAARWWVTNVSQPHVYEVEPLIEGPHAWNGSGDDGWVSPSARIIRKLDPEEHRHAHRTATSTYYHDEWQKWQQGGCLEYAHALKQKYPHLGIGALVEHAPADKWGGPYTMEQHFFAHDDTPYWADAWDDEDDDDDDLVRRVALVRDPVPTETRLRSRIPHLPLDGPLSDHPAAQRFQEYLDAGLADPDPQEALEEYLSVWRPDDRIHYDELQRYIGQEPTDNYPFPPHRPIPATPREPDAVVTYPPGYELEYDDPRPGNHYASTDNANESLIDSLANWEDADHPGNIIKLRNAPPRGYPRVVLPVVRQESLNDLYNAQMKAQMSPLVDYLNRGGDKAEDLDFGSTDRHWPSEYGREVTKLSSSAAIRRRAANVTEDLIGNLARQFDGWWKDKGEPDWLRDKGFDWSDYEEFTGDDRGPAGHWPVIEKFFEDNYPAVKRDHKMGLEHVDPALKSGDYDATPEQIEEYGYNPAEIAAGMLLLHNTTHPNRQDFLGYDIDLLNGIVRKRMQMQDDYRARQPITAAVNQDLVDGLHDEFTGWWEENQHNQPEWIDYTEGERGPIGFWPHVEAFLKDKYPAAYRNKVFGYEGVADLLDVPDLVRGEPYETGPDAEAQHGYDPKEIASAMLLLHNRSDPLRGDLAQEDQDRLTKIFQKRQQMQRDYEQRTAAIEFPYHRNNNGIRALAPRDEYGQDTEPWGYYMNFDGGDGEIPGDLPAGYERGIAAFDNPLYVDHADGEWKRLLSDQYGGSVGRGLSRKLQDDGYDGVITHDDYGIGEMVDIRPKGQRGHRTATTRRLSAFAKDFVEDLRRQFTEWNGGSHHDLGHWPIIEDFLRDNYPAVSRDIGFGLEEARPLLRGEGFFYDGDTDYSDLKPYETGPKAIATHGYDPKAVAAGMVYLHNDYNNNRYPGSRDDNLMEDEDLLNDIFQKRQQMQRDHEQRTAATPVTVYHGTSPDKAQAILDGQSWLPGNGGWFTSEYDRARAYGPSVIALDLPPHRVPARQPEFYLPHQTRILRKGPFRLAEPKETTDV